jgi:type III pantothenate kinase
MLLAIDCGNSNTVFALYEGERQRAKWRAGTVPDRSGNAWADWLCQVMAIAGFTPCDIDSAIVGNVVEPLEKPLASLCRRLGVEPLLADHLLPSTGMALRVERPQQLGIDRALNALAARARYALPAVVVDFGTVTKFDLVAEDGGYEGGVLCPGFELGLAALHRCLSRVPAVALSRPDRTIGRTTEAALSAGALWGYVALVEGLLARIAREHGRLATVVATGGIAPLLVPLTTVFAHHAPDLTLDGLALLYQGNR